MTKLESQFCEHTEKTPITSSFLCFVRAVTDVQPSTKEIKIGLERLVEKHDYDKKDKETLINFLVSKVV